RAECPLARPPRDELRRGEALESLLSLFGQLLHTALERLEAKLQHDIPGVVNRMRRPQVVGFAEKEAPEAAEAGTTRRHRSRPRSSCGELLRDEPAREGVTARAGMDPSPGALAL